MYFRTTFVCLLSFILKEYIVKKVKIILKNKLKKMSGKTGTSPCPQNKMKDVGSKCDHHFSFGEGYKKCKNYQQ